MLAKQSALEGIWLEGLALLLAGVGAAWFTAAFQSLTSKILVADPLPAYGAIAGVQGALLGFVLAALTIVIGYANGPALRVLRDAGQLPNLLRVYTSGTRALALATVMALAALLVQSSSPIGSLLAWLVGTTSLLALLRLSRTLWATRAVVARLGAPLTRGAGQR
jgi:hypothetical protein